MQREIDDMNVKATGPTSVRRAPAVDRSRSVRARYRRFYRLMAITDVAAIVSACLLAYLFWIPDRPADPGLVVLLLIVGPPVVLALYSAIHLYEAHRYSPAEEFRRIILAVSLAVAAIVVISFGSKTNPDPSRGWLLLSWVFAVVLALATRRLWHAKIGHERAYGSLSFPTLIVGSNDEAHHLWELMEAPAFGFKALGLVSTEHTMLGHQGSDLDDLPIVGTISHLREVIREWGAECVFVAATALPTAEMKHVAKAVRLEGVEVRITATLPEVLSSRVAVQSLRGLTALSLQPVRLTGTQAALKRAFDVSLAGLGIVVLAPVFGIVALAGQVVLARAHPLPPDAGRSPRPPVHDAQVPDDEGGRPRDGGGARASHGVEDFLFKLEHDPEGHRGRPRLAEVQPRRAATADQRRSRRYEPRGPPPAVAEEVKRYEDWQFDRLEAPPGCSGLCQVSGRSELSFDDAVRLDLFDIENWSLAYDLYILAKTIPALLSNRGAY